MTEQHPSRLRLGESDLSRTRRVVAIIPARYGSQRFPGKPLADIDGKPMVQHVYEQTGRAALVDAVIVATDDERIASAVRAFGGHAVMTPHSLHTGTDRVAWVARSLDDAEIVLNVQGDEPLIAPEMIDEAVRPLILDREIMVGTLIHRIETIEELHSPNVIKVVTDATGYALYFSRLPIPYARDVQRTDVLNHQTFYKHIGLYVFRKNFLLRFPDMRQTPLELLEKLEQLRVLEHGYKIKATVTAYDSIPVDTQEDLDKVRAMIQNK